MSQSSQAVLSGQIVKSKRFKTTRILVESGGVQVCIRHGAGKFDLTLTAPLTIDVVQAVKRSREPGARLRPARTGAKH